MAPEKWWLEDKPFLLGETVTFQGFFLAVKLREGMCFFGGWLEKVKQTYESPVDIGDFHGTWLVGINKSL